MTNPEIPLQVKTPQVASPLESMGQAQQLIALRNQNALAPLRQQELSQQIATGAIANQEAQLKQHDDQIVTQTYQAAGGDPAKHVQLAAQAGARPQAVQGLEKHYNDIAEQRAKTSKDQADTDKVRDDQLAALTNEAINTPDDQLAAVWPGLKQRAEAIDPKLKLPDAVPDKNALVHIGLGYRTLQLIDQANEEKRKAELQPLNVAEKKGAVAAQVAALPGVTAESTIKGAEAGAMNMTPEQAKAKVDAVIDPDKYPAENARALAMYNGALTLKDKNESLQKIEGQIAEIEKETNPKVRAARVAQAVATETATAPIKIRAAVQQQIEMAKSAPGGFDTIQNPAARAAAQSKYEKDSSEFADKWNESQRLKDLIASAQGGNKAAPAVIPIEELRGFVNRVSSQELKSVSSGAGDAIDRVEGFIKGYTAGQTIPAAILADTTKLADLNAKAARRAYESKVAINHTTYGSKVSPIDLGSEQSTGSAIPPEVAAVLKGAGPGIHTLSDGSKWMTDQHGNITKQ